MKTHLYSVAVAAALILATSTVHAAVLLEVDVSDPADVTFTATGNAPGAEASVRLYYGVDLLLFFTGAVQPLEIALPVTGDLINRVGVPEYRDFVPDNYSSGSSLYQDLNLFGGTSDYQYFTPTMPSFSGVGRADMSDYAAVLPAAGSSGEILAGYSGSPTQVLIGEWQVVPEPALAIVPAVAGLMLRRRHPTMRSRRC